MNEICPDCRKATVPRNPIDPISWRKCEHCGWDERRQLMQKMRDEMDNSPGP